MRIPLSNNGADAPSVSTLVSVEGTGADDVWTTWEVHPGDDPSLLVLAPAHWDGSAWSAIALPAQTADSPVQALASAGPGSAYASTGRQLFLVSAGGEVTELSPPGPMVTGTALAGAGGELFVVAPETEAHAWIARYDGDAWESIPLPTAPEPLSGLNFGIASAVPGELWVSHGGTPSTGEGENPAPISRWDGAEWLEFPDPPVSLAGLETMVAVGGERLFLRAPIGVDWVRDVADDEPFVVGSTTEGSIARFDGQTWTVEAIPVPEERQEDPDVRYQDLTLVPSGDGVGLLSGRVDAQGDAGLRLRRDVVVQSWDGEALGRPDLFAVHHRNCNDGAPDAAARFCDGEIAYQESYTIDLRASVMEDGQVAAVVGNMNPRPPAIYVGAPR